MRVRESSHGPMAGRMCTPQADPASKRACTSTKSEEVHIGFESRSRNQIGLEETVEHLRRRYRFPGMEKYIQSHLKACLDCVYSKEKSDKWDGLTNVIRAEHRPWTKIFIDHQGPLIKSNEKDHILAVVDGLTEFMLLEVLMGMKTSEVIKFSQKLFAMYGKPDEIVPDQGTAFTSGKFKTFLEEQAITTDITTSRRHANADGRVERMNKDISRTLRSLCQKEDCSDWSK